jgi:hypothetical protein
LAAGIIGVIFAGVKACQVSTANKAAFSVRKASPEIALAAGIIGVIFAGVKACQATLKVQPIVEKQKTDLITFTRQKKQKDLLTQNPIITIRKISMQRTLQVPIQSQVLNLQSCMDRQLLLGQRLWLLS